MKRMTLMLALAALLSGTAFAAPGKGPHGVPFPHDPGKAIVKMAEELKLTPEQKRKVALILKENRDKAKALRDGMKDAAGHMGDVMIKSSGDEAAVRQAAREMAKAGEELAVHAARVKTAIDEVLTPEQKAQLAAKRDEIKNRFRDRSEKRGKALDNWIEEQLKS